MTFSELKQHHSDILSDEITWEELLQKANGAALFYVSLSGGIQPKDNRQILWAGHILTAGITLSEQLYIIRRTAKGNPKIDIISRKELEQRQRIALFHTHPIPADDMRNMTSWNRWD